MRRALFNSGIVPVTTEWTKVATLLPLGDSLSMSGVVGDGGALAHLKITRETQAGTPAKTILEDGDFALAPRLLEDCVPSNPHQTAAGGSFQMTLLARGDVLHVWARAAAAPTTLWLRGNIWYERT